MRQTFWQGFRAYTERRELRICAVIDYATKYCLAAEITPTGRRSDAMACLDAAVAEAERVLGLVG